MKQAELKERFLEWLRPSGIKYLKGIKEKYGEIAACWNEGGIPHPVHFREGMQIRNWMRDQPEFADNLDCHWLDNNWEKFTEECLKETNETV